MLEYISIQLKKLLICTRGCIHAREENKKLEKVNIKEEIKEKKQEKEKNDVWKIK